MSSSEVASNPEVSPTAAPIVPRITVKPNLKATQNKTSYSVALDNMIAEFSAPYFSDQMTPEQRTQTELEVSETTNMIRGLCDQYLRPLCQDRPQTGGAVTNVQQQAQVATAPAKKALSDWQILLKYAKDIVPGHQTSTDKMNLSKAFYNQMSDQDCANLRARYELEHPEAVAAAAAAASQPATTQGGDKKKRQTGFTVFSKQWYAEFKKANPDAGGLQSSLCSEAWKALPENEKTEWKNLAKQQ
jgi:hypothetical protein